MNNEKSLKRWRLAAIILAVCLIAVLAIGAYNREVVRRHHLDSVHHSLFWFFTEIQRSAFYMEHEYTDEDMWEMRLSQVRIPMYGLNGSLNALLRHHNFREEGTAFPFFPLRIIFEYIFRHSENPVDDLQFIADKLHNLRESHSQAISTRELIRTINETNDQISRHFGFGGMTSE